MFSNPKKFIKQLEAQENTDKWNKVIYLAMITTNINSQRKQKAYKCKQLSVSGSTEQQTEAELSTVWAEGATLTGERIGILFLAQACQTIGS